MYLVCIWFVSGVYLVELAHHRCGRGWVMRPALRHAFLYLGCIWSVSSLYMAKLAHHRVNIARVLRPALKTV